MSFTLQILGASCAVPNPDSATSGYLLCTPTTYVLLECGHGTVGKLLRFGSVADLNAVVVSHMHPDHCLDLVALRNYVYVHKLPRIPLYVPSNGPSTLHGLALALTLGDGYFEVAFDVRTYGPESPVDVGDLRFDAVRANHNTVANALRIVDGSDRSLVFSSDTGPFNGLFELADGCDLLLIEATEPTSLSGPRWHMAPGDVAEVISRTTPSRTVLTHYAAEHANGILARVRAALPPGVVLGDTVSLAVEGERYVIEH